MDHQESSPKYASAADRNNTSGRDYMQAEIDERGAVFTRREVVDFILDLVGYTEHQPLHTFRLLEPSSGEGDFLLPIIGRLVRSYFSHGGKTTKVGSDLADSLLAVEVHPSSITMTRHSIQQELRSNGVPDSAAKKLANKWLIQDDFLQASISGEFTHVVGNPPYVRQELIPAPLLAKYRESYKTLYDRADLYVPFFERSLELLAPGGRLGFICTDRWTKNKYGGPLRKLVSSRFALTHYVDLLNAPAFTSEVMTYPAITVIKRPQRAGVKVQTTRAAYQPPIDADALFSLATALTSRRVPPQRGVVELTEVVNGSEPWLLHDPDRLSLVRRLEASLPTLEQAGCKVGIGVATGNDRVFIGPIESFDVEPGRVLPLARTQDLAADGNVSWKGMGVLNPFEDDGRVVDLARYPRFAKVIRQHEQAIRSRNVAKRNAVGWFRTIDRIYPALVERHKLLVPDIKGDATVVYEPGKLYPHHNLYYITAEDWNLHALQAVLLSGIARLFVGTYSTPMRGGFLRYQAQYLRRIRVPYWKDVPASLRNALKAAGKCRNLDAARAAAFDLYNLTERERAAITSI